MCFLQTHTYWAWGERRTQYFCVGFHSFDCVRKHTSNLAAAGSSWQGHNRQLFVLFVGALNGLGVFFEGFQSL